jgi:hypothetical protein
MKVKATLLAVLALASSAFGASTLNLRNFSSATVGVPIVNSEGASLTAGTFFVNGGYFNTTMNWSTATAATIKAAFVSIDNTPLSGGTRNGLITGQTFNGVLPVGFAGTQAYVVFADSADFSAATVFAVFNAGAVFTTPDVVGNSAQTLDALNSANVLFGTVRSVTTQPNNLTGANFANGVQMVSAAVPEPSIALLGALGIFGLVRRRR